MERVTVKLKAYIKAQESVSQILAALEALDNDPEWQALKATLPPSVMHS